MGEVKFEDIKGKTLSHVVVKRSYGHGEDSIEFFFEK